MIATLSAWLSRGRCLWHADPIFDRNERGEAMFRCPDCLNTWPILLGVARCLDEVRRTPRARRLVVVAEAHTHKAA
jgi:hypothetical protein